MKFITIRDLRGNTARIRRDLEAEREVVITANGRPFAVMTRVEPDKLEEEILAIRRARARAALSRIRVKAKAEGSGNHVFRVEVRSEPTGTRLVREGTTRFYGTLATSPPASASPSPEKAPPTSSTVPAETRTADRRDAPSASKADPPAGGTRPR